MKNSDSVVVVSDTTPLLADPTQGPNTSTTIRYESIGDDVEGYSTRSEEPEATLKGEDFSFGSVLALLLIGTIYILRRVFFYFPPPEFWINDSK